MTNWIKSVFIASYFTLLPVGTVIAAWQLMTNGTSLAEWGLLLAFVPPTGYFIFIYLVGLARTNASVWGIAVGSLLGLILVIVGEWEGIGMIKGEVQLASAAFFGWLVYLLWYLKNERLSSPMLLIGKRLPEFTLFDAEAKEIKSDALSHPALFLFHRGNWCPFCTTQVKELAEEYGKIADSGITMYIVSPQPESHNANLAKRFSVPFVALRDRANAAATRLGILHEAGLPMGLQVLGYDTDTVYPTIIITDGQGKIRFTDQTDNYRLRPEPEAFINVIQGLQVTPPSS